jgi:hypothetical protein
MNTAVFVRILVCIAVMGCFLYAYISKQNSITELRLHIPVAARELERVLQENTQLQFEIDQFENPQHLMELASQPQFSYLKYPLLDEIITLEVP